MASPFHVHTIQTWTWTWPSPGLSSSLNYFLDLFFYLILPILFDPHTEPTGSYPDGKIAMDALSTGVRLVAEIDESFGRRSRPPRLVIRDRSQRFRVFSSETRLKSTLEGSSLSPRCLDYVLRNGMVRVSTYYWFRVCTVDVTNLLAQRPTKV